MKSTFPPWFRDEKSRLFLVHFHPSTKRSLENPLGKIKFPESFLFSFENHNYYNNYFHKIWIYTFMKIIVVIIHSIWIFGNDDVIKRLSKIQFFARPGSEQVQMTLRCRTLILASQILLLEQEASKICAAFQSFQYCTLLYEHYNNLSIILKRPLYPCYEYC